MPPLFKPQQRATLVNNKSRGMQRTQSVASHAGQARACRPLRRVGLAASSTVDISVVVGAFMLRLHAGGHAAPKMAAVPPQCTEELGVKQSRDARYFLVNTDHVTSGLHTENSCKFDLKITTKGLP